MAMNRQMTDKEFTAVYNEKRDVVFNYINWKINNVTEAEELTINVLMKARRLYPTFDPQKSDFSTWLQTITNSAIIDYYRTNHSDKYTNVSNFVNSEGDEVFQFVSDNDTDDNINNSELRDRIERAYSNLKPKYRKIAKLFFEDELEYSEIAEQCNVPMGTVKGMINRARTMLQNELAGAYNVRGKKVIA